MSEIENLDLPFWIELLSRRQEIESVKEKNKLKTVDEIRW